MTTTDTPTRHHTSDSQAARAGGGTDHRPGHSDLDTQAPHAGSVQTTPQASSATSPIPAAPVGSNPAQNGVGSATTRAASTPSPLASLADPTLDFAAEVLDDIERTKIANQNRLRQLTRGGPDDERIRSGKYACVEDLPPDKDDEPRGFRLDYFDPDVARLAALVQKLDEVEHQATLNLRRKMRHHPLGPWVKAQRGMGEKQAARLLAVIGDPYWHTAEDRPRLVSELWSWCGYKPGQRRVKGVQSRWSSIAKSRAYLIADKMLELGNREMYDRRKAATASRVHDKRCPPCKGSSEIGQPWRDGHRHHDALRYVAKNYVLKGLWREAKRLHEGGEP